jgi:hypothetical protein
VPRATGIGVELRAAAHSFIRDDAVDYFLL